MRFHLVLQFCGFWDFNSFSTPLTVMSMSSKFRQDSSLLVMLEFLRGVAFLVAEGFVEPSGHQAFKKKYILFNCFLLILKDKKCTMVLPSTSYSKINYFVAMHEQY